MILNTNYFRNTSDMYCYKSAEAFKTEDEICYISESSLEMIAENGGAAIMDKFTLLSYGAETKATIKEKISQHIAEYYDDVIYPDEESFLNEMATFIFIGLNWECVETRIEDTDFEALYGPNRGIKYKRVHES